LLKKGKRSRMNRIIKMTLKIVIVIIIAISLLMNLFTFVIPIVKYYGTSMEPTLQDGQILVINKLSEVESGDIIAFYYNDKVLVRRVISEGSQQVSMDIFGTVRVNGEELEEPYTNNKTYGQCNLEFPYYVPAASFFVMGDNREQYMDSRLEEIGPVTEDRLIGKVVFAINPFDILTNSK